MSKLTLLDLSDRLGELEETIENLDSTEMPEELKTAFDELLCDRNTAQSDYEDKINNILLLIKGREAWVQIRQERIKEIQALIKTDQNLINRLKKYLMDHLIERDHQKFRTRDFNISVARNGGKTPIIIDEDITFAELPEQYIKITRAIDKKAVADALKDGEVLDFARQGIRENHLRIK